MRAAGKVFDVVVVGGGHAGCEAAAAAARVGAEVGLCTQRAGDLGVMSCNPSFGGVAKGTLVREIDAMGGLMARAADLAAIQFRVLNRSKGPAVHGPRVQADRAQYHTAMQQMISAQPRLSVVEGGVLDLLLEPDGRVAGVSLNDGRRIAARKVVLTTGTFLRGVIHCGPKSWPAGRMGEAPAIGLADTLERAGFPLGRLSTSTPPRLEKSSIDYSELTVQESDDPPSCMSFGSDWTALPNVVRACRLVYAEPAQVNQQLQPCHLSWTSEETERVVLEALQAPGQLAQFESQDSFGRAGNSPRCLGPGSCVIRAADTVCLSRRNASVSPVGGITCGWSRKGGTRRWFIRLGYPRH